MYGYEKSVTNGCKGREREQKGKHTEGASLQMETVLHWCISSCSVGIFSVLLLSSCSFSSFWRLIFLHMIPDINKLKHSPKKRVYWGHQCVAEACPRQTEEPGALQHGRPAAGQQFCYFNVYFTCVYDCSCIFMVWSCAYVGSSECRLVQWYTTVAAFVICS